MRSPEHLCYMQEESLIVPTYSVSQLGIAIIGFIPALQRLRLHLYKEESEDEGQYRIRLPQEPVVGKQAPMPVFP